MPNAVGHLGLRLVMLQSSGALQSACVALLWLQMRVSAGKGRTAQESGQEVPWCHGEWAQSSMLKAAFAIGLISHFVIDVLICIKQGVIFILFLLVPLTFK